VPLTSDFEVGEPRITRRSPLTPTVKLCPRCLKPLQKGSKLGGWLVPQDYYCTSCGYKGTVFLEKSSSEGEPHD
jgi:transposase-like protein